MEALVMKNGMSVIDTLSNLQIDYSRYLAPHDFSDEDDSSFWQRTGATRCKNLFLRNHKGDRHFLIVAPYYEEVQIRILEKHFNKGKISFASNSRLMRYMGVEPGAVSVFGLFNDINHHTEVFIDSRLPQCRMVSFLANRKGEIITFSYDSLIALLHCAGNKFTIMKLHN